MINLKLWPVSHVALVSVDDSRSSFVTFKFVEKDQRQSALQSGYVFRYSLPIRTVEARLVFRISKLTYVVLGLIDFCCLPKIL